ncbi:hypothetical protein [Nonomuraea helvata]|uniref:Enoyl-CoA hydratase/isomerase family protein n=1 Tax=Nonomuraea helvata TaxID=37484 RepID=A0ABV5SER7_9ACTN
MAQEPHSLQECGVRPRQRGSQPRSARLAGRTRHQLPPDRFPASVGKRRGYADVRFTQGKHRESKTLTKYSLNNWLRLAGPAFDASLAMEFLGFTGPDVAEGVRALREKRPPSFG